MSQRGIQNPVKNLTWNLLQKQNSLTILAKSSILDIWVGSKYASVSCLVNQITAYNQIDRPCEIFRYNRGDERFKLTIQLNLYLVINMYLWKKQRQKNKKTNWRKNDITEVQ